MPLLNLGRALTVATEGPNAIGHGKKYTRQQREKRHEIKSAYPPGGAPPMRKISAKQALRSCLNKQAASPRKLPIGLNEVFRGIGLAAGVGGTAMAGRGLAVGVGGVYQKMQSNRMFDELNRRYPEIKRHPKAREYFDMAIAYAPSLLRHPAAIGDFLRRQLEYPMSGHEYIKQLADLESTVVGTESKRAPAQFGQAIGQGGGMTGMFQRTE